MQMIASAAGSPSATVVAYGETPEMRTRIGHLLPAANARATGTRSAFESMAGNAMAAIAALESCDHGDVAWLGTACGDGLCGPSRIIVTRYTLIRSLRLRRYESSRLHVVWAEELDERLPRFLNGAAAWHRDPLRLAGYRLLNESPVRWPLVRAIDQLCNVFGGPPAGPPPSSVAGLARRSAVPADTLRRQWRDSVPLSCGLKQVLGWALLFWGIRRRAHTGWDDIARQAGVRRRTLERASVRLAGVTLAGLAHDPQRVRDRFREWVREHSEAARRQVDEPALPQSQACPFPGAEKIRS